MPSAPRAYRLLLTTWQDFGAGSIQSVQYLAQGLLARGHDLRVACPADGVLGVRLRENGVPVVPFDFAKGWSLRTARKLAEVIREHDIELVDAQESRDRKAAVLARLVLRTRNRLVITRRQMTASFPLQNALYSAAADRIIAISQGVADDLARHGMSARKISVVHTGLDPARVAGAVSEAEVQTLRDEMGLDPALPTVGVVARRKDQETLLRAVGELARPLNILFVGIEKDASLAALEPALPTGTRVAYTGFRERVLPFYSLLDVMVLTTIREGLSQAILESMALGVPVISAAVGGTPEVVSPEVNGLLYPPSDHHALADHLRRLLDDPALQATFVQGGRATVSGPFHADSLAAGTEAVYRELIGP
ncbi:MAG TPA: glycosyltransferase family 4 protein [Longimicrobiaceae bacterium]|nr:glycosyltransferase family 4 protein [Longimicrobiaceae bacterium]